MSGVDRLLCDAVSRRSPPLRGPHAPASIERRCALAAGRTTASRDALDELARRQGREARPWPRYTTCAPMEVSQSSGAARLAVVGYVAGEKVVDLVQFGHRQTNARVRSE